MQAAYVPVPIFFPKTQKEISPPTIQKRKKVVNGWF